jgi:hypothetical protein
VSEEADIEVRDRSAYELACIDAIQSRLSRIGNAAAHFGRTDLKSHLVGNDPGTTIAFTWKERGNPRVGTVPLWDAAAADLNAGRALHPEVLALILTAELEEPGQVAFEDRAT